MPQQNNQELEEILLNVGVNTTRAAVEEVKKLSPAELNKTISFTDDEGNEITMKMPDYVAQVVIYDYLRAVAIDNDIRLQVKTEEQIKEPKIFNKEGSRGIIYVDVDECDGTRNAMERKGVHACNMAFTRLYKREKKILYFKDFRLGFISLTNGDTYFGNSKKTKLFDGKKFYPVRTSNKTTIKRNRVYTDPYPTSIFCETEGVTNILLAGPYLDLDKLTFRCLSTHCSAGAELCGLLVADINEEGVDMSDTCLGWVSTCQPQENLIEFNVLQRPTNAVMTDRYGNKIENHEVSMRGVPHLTDVIIGANQYAYRDLFNIFGRDPKDSEIWREYLKAKFRNAAQFN